MNRDRYNMQDTPESDEECEAARQAAYDRADWERDERRDREMEECQ